MTEHREGHVSERFVRFLMLYRKPDGSEWGGQDLERATGGAITRSYVSNLRKGRIQNPGLAKLKAIARAMGFPPGLWFGERTETGEDLKAAYGGALEDRTLTALLEEAIRLNGRDRDLLLRIARQISPPDVRG